MKNAIKVVAVALVLVMMVATLASCSGLNGKYVNADGEWIEFDGDEFTMGYEGSTVTISGTYEIDGDKITMTISGMTQTTDFAKDGDTITIGTDKYTKA